MGNKTFIYVHITRQCYIGHYVIRTGHRVKLYHQVTIGFVHVYHCTSELGCIAGLYVVWVTRDLYINMSTFVYVYVTGLDCITRQYMTRITTHLCYELCQMSVYVCICHRDKLGIKMFVYIRLYDRTYVVWVMTLMDVYVTGQCYIGHYMIRTCKLYRKSHKRFMYVYHLLSAVAFMKKFIPSEKRFSQAILVLFRYFKSQKQKSLYFEYISLQSITAFSTCYSARMSYCMPQIKANLNRARTRVC